jgi:hypothetical protein
MDHALAIASLAAGEPGQRALGGVGRDGGAALAGLDLDLCEFEMLPEERIDLPSPCASA